MNHTSKFKLLDTEQHGNTRTDHKYDGNLVFNPCLSVCVRVQIWFNRYFEYCLMK